ncbi:Sialidase [Xylariaceae sp. FL0804]|nr:Sialidase [Xylariaceae sp. FL0804]
MMLRPSSPAVLVAAALSLTTLTPAASATPVPGPVRDLADIVLFTPPSNYTDPGTLYARAAELPDGRLLATRENYSPDDPPASAAAGAPPVYFPIFESADGGATWAEVARVRDRALGWGLRYQPFLTHIELYASVDQGRSWRFVSHPSLLLLLHGGRRLICCYSDQRDPAHGQKLVHQALASKEDGGGVLRWGPVVDDVAEANYTDRPGMLTVAALPEGTYIAAYEFGGGYNPGGGENYTFPVYYKLARDPEGFGRVDGQLLQTRDGTVPEGSPYVVWTPASGPRGTVVVSSGCCSEVFINRELGAPDAWETMPTPEGISYSRSLIVFRQNPEYFLLAGGGLAPPSTTNQVSVSVTKVD